MSWKGPGSVVEVSWKHELVTEVRWRCEGRVGTVVEVAGLRVYGLQACRPSHVSRSCASGASPSLRRSFFRNVYGDLCLKTRISGWNTEEREYYNRSSW